MKTTSRSIELARSPYGFLIQDLERAAVHAMSGICGVSDCKIEATDDHSVVISYEWNPDGAPWGGDRIARCGLTKVH